MHVTLITYEPGQLLTLCYNVGKTPESGIPTSYRATRRYTEVHLGFCLRFSTLIDWSNRPRTAFRRWTQAVHQVAAIQVGRHRFLACPYRFLAAKKQAKADLSAGHSHDRTAFESFALDISEQPDPNLTDTQPWQPTSLSKIPTHTARGCHTHARTYNARQRDKSPDSPATPCRTGGEINVVLQQQRMVRV